MRMRVGMFVDGTEVAGARAVRFGGREGGSVCM